MTSLVFVLLWRSGKAALLILGIFVLRRLFRHRLSPRVRHAVWLMVPAVLFVAITVPLPVTPADRLEIQPVPMPEFTVQAALSTPEFESTPVAAPEIAETFPVEEVGEKTAAQTAISIPASIFTLVWIFGTVMIGGTILLQALRGVNRLRKSVPVTDEAALRLFEECRRSIGVRSWVLLAESPEIPAPLLAGVIRPVILFPEGLTRRLDIESLRHIYLHELAHLRRGDLWTGWLMSFCLAVHWFNPFLWSAIRRMNTDREEACDMMALKSLDADARIGYGNTLLDMGETLARLPRKLSAGIMAGIFENPLTMKRRIEMIRHPETLSPLWTRVFLVLLLLGVTALMGEAQTKKPDAAKNETETSAGDDFDKDDPSELFESAAKPLKPGKYTGDEAKKIGMQVFERIIETNRHWLYAPKWDAKRWTYTFAAQLESGEKMEKKMKIDREDPKSSSAWTDIRGISLIPVPQGLADFMSSSESSLSIKNAEVTKTQIKLHFQFSGNDSAFQMAGMGLGSSFFGFTSGKAAEGMLYVNPADYTLTGVKLASGGYEKYGDYVALDETHKVPRRIEVEFVSGRNKTYFDFRFKAYEPGIWLFDRGEYKLNGRKTSIGKLVDVTVNDSAPVEIEPPKTR